MKNLKFFSRFDAILIIAVLAAVGAWLGFQSLAPKAAKAVVLVHGRRYETLTLDKAATFDIKWDGVHIMTVKTEPGKVRVTYSTCKAQICVHTGWISRDGQSIVCVPNQVIIYTEGAKSALYDLMTSQ